MGYAAVDDLNFYCCSFATMTGSANRSQCQPLALPTMVLITHLT